MGYFHFSVNGAHLIDCFDLWRESAVNAKDFVVDECAQGEIVECIVEVLPWGRAAILFDDFIIESVYCGNLA